MDSEHVRQRVQVPKYGGIRSQTLTLYSLLAPYTMIFGSFTLWTLKKHRSAQPHLQLLQAPAQREEPVWGRLTGFAGCYLAARVGNFQLRMLSDSRGPSIFNLSSSAFPAGSSAQLGEHPQHNRTHRPAARDADLENLNLQKKAGQIASCC